MSNGKNNKVLLGSGLLLAVTSSLCCIIPVLTIIGGAGGTVAAFSWAAPLRPFWLGTRGWVLGFAFYRSYNRERREDGGCGEKKREWRPKIFHWAVDGIYFLFSS